MELELPTISNGFSPIEDFDQLTTPALKTHIRLVAEYKNGLNTILEKVIEYQVDAIKALCVRHDAGDLIEFFRELNYQPSIEVRRLLVKELPALNIPHAVTAAVVGKTENAVEIAVRRGRMSEKSVDPSPDGQLDNSDIRYEAPQPVKKKDTRRALLDVMSEEVDKLERSVIKLESLKEDDRYSKANKQPVINRINRLAERLTSLG